MKQRPPHPNLIEFGVTADSLLHLHFTLLGSMAAVQREAHDKGKEGKAPSVTISAARLMMHLSSAVMWLQAIERDASQPDSPQHAAFASSIDEVLDAYEVICEAYEAAGTPL